MAIGDIVDATWYSLLCRNSRSQIGSSFDHLALSPLDLHSVVLLPIISNPGLHLYVHVSPICLPSQVEYPFSGPSDSSSQTAEITVANAVKCQDLNCLDCPVPQY